MKRINFFERLSALVVLFAVGSMVAMATNFKSKANVKVENVGEGRVYVSKSNSKPADYKFKTEDSSSQDETTRNAPTHTYYVWALPGFGYEFDSWSPEISNGQVSIQANSNESNATKTYTAKFKTRTVSFDNPQVGTYQIMNPSADEDLATGWSATNYQKSNENTFQFIHWEGNHMSGEISQTVNDIPNGFYKVSVKYVGVWNDFTLSANNDKSTVGAGNTEWRSLDVFTNVIDEKIIIKLENKCTGSGSEWCAVDDFTLTYYGSGEETITLNASGYATFSRAYATELDGAGVYTAKINDGKISCTEVGDGVVPAGVGVLLYGEANATVTVTPTTTDKTILDNNELKASTLANGSLAVKPASGAYTLSGDTFKTYNKEEFVHGKAYFEKPSTTDTKLFSIEFEETTAISTIKSNVEGVAYNLAGQRVAPTTKGIVIINGKKYFNK